MLQRHDNPITGSLAIDAVINAAFACLCKIIMTIIVLAQSAELFM